MRAISRVPLFVLLWSLVSFADAQESWNVVLTRGDTLREYIPLDVTQDLTMLKGSDTLVVPVDSVHSVFRVSEGGFWKGAGYGALTGAVAGALVGRMSYKKPAPDPNAFISIDFGPGFATIGGAIVGTLGGTVIGGIIGASSGGVEVRDLSDQPRSEQIMILRHLWGLRK